MNNKMMNMYREAAMKSTMSENDKNRILRHIDCLDDTEINIMLIGSTGAGKSSTINALLGREIAKVGVGVEPETMDIRKYGVGNLIFWDTPGLGDGKVADVAHSKKIIDKLNELDKNGSPLIDIVLLIVDGGNRDMGTEYQFINDVIKPNIGKYAKGRILVAINQADMAMKGNNWDIAANRPNEKLVEFLEDKVKSVRRRLAEATGIYTTPVYYAAGYKYADSAQEEAYNVDELFFYILKNLRFSKRQLNTTDVKNAKLSTSQDSAISSQDTMPSYLCSLHNALNVVDDDDDDDGYRYTFNDVAYDVTMGFFNAVDSVLSHTIDFFDSLL